MKQFDVVGIGNAIVDILTYCDDAFLAGEGLKKSTMTLVDEARSQALYKKIGASKECSGGSVANTMAALASLGSRAAFIGKVADDQLGSIFTHDLRSVGVRYHTPPSKGGPSTANCIVMVTPDAQRTMATYLGACGLFNEEDVDGEMIAASHVLYLEGYLWNEKHNKVALEEAISFAHAHGVKVAFTLSDRFCVEAHRDELLALVRNDIDILFANESEIKALLLANDVDEAITAVRGLCPLAAITVGEQGSVVVTPEHTHRVPAAAVEKLVDTTGAGDLFAAGFLHALAHGEALPDCADLGNRCAAEIIQQLGARSLKPLKDLFL